MGAGEELWGHGEAMAGDDDLSATQSQPDSDQGKTVDVSVVHG